MVKNTLLERNPVEELNECIADALSEKLIAKIKLKQQKLKLKMERDTARREEAKRLKEATVARL